MNEIDSSSIISYFIFDSIGSLFPPLLLDEAIVESKNNKIHFIYCDSYLKSCSINYFKSTFLCVECNINRKQLIDQFKPYSNIEFIALSSMRFEDNLSEEKEFKFNSLDEIKNLKYKGIQFGLGIVSSFVSKTRNINPSLNSNTKQALENLIESACLNIDLIENYISKNNVKKIKFCNGRTLHEKVVFELAKKNKIPFEILELTTSSTHNVYKKINYGNNSPHSIKNTTKLIESVWLENYNRIEKENIAKSFYERRRFGMFASDKIYTSNQKLGQKPKNWNEKKRNVVIFNSSEDEIYSIGDEWEENKIFGSQLEGIKYIAQELKNRTEYCLTLRIHPNLNGLNFSYVTDLSKLAKDFSELIIIAPDDPVSSYTLIDEADIIVVFGSSIGAEANYWRKPVISLSPSFYQNLNLAYYPQNREELSQLLQKENLRPKSIQGSLQYGYYMRAEKGENFHKVKFSYKSTKIFGRNIILNDYLSHKSLLIKFILRVIRMVLSIGSQSREKDLLKERTNNTFKSRG